MAPSHILGYHIAIILARFDPGSCLPAPHSRSPRALPWCLGLPWGIVPKEHSVGALFSRANGSLNYRGARIKLGQLTDLRCSMLSKRADVTANLVAIVVVPVPRPTIEHEASRPPSRDPDSSSFVQHLLRLRLGFDSGPTELDR
jgi:hypothetical protein